MRRILPFEGSSANRTRTSLGGSSESQSRERPPDRQRVPDDLYFVSTMRRLRWHLSSPPRNCSPSRLVGRALVLVHLGDQVMQSAAEAGRSGPVNVTIRKADGTVEDGCICS